MCSELNNDNEVRPSDDPWDPHATEGCARTIIQIETETY